MTDETQFSEKWIDKINGDLGRNAVVVPYMKQTSGMEFVACVYSLRCKVSNASQNQTCQNILLTLMCLEIKLIRVLPSRS